MIGICRGCRRRVRWKRPLLVRGPRLVDAPSVPGGIRTSPKQCAPRSHVQRKRPCAAALSNGGPSTTSSGVPPKPDTRPPTVAQTSRLGHVKRSPTEDGTDWLTIERANLEHEDLCRKCLRVYFESQQPVEVP